MEVSEPARTTILYVITKANWGGAQRYVYDLATAAQGAGHSVSVAAGMPGELVSRLTEQHIPVHVIDSLGRDVRPLADAFAFVELVRLMHRIRPTVVHTNSSKAGIMAAVAARLTGARKVVFTAHAWAFNEQRPQWQKIIIAGIHYLTVLVSDTTVCVSNALLQDTRWMPFVQKRFVVIYNGVARQDPLPRDEARTKLASDLSQPFWIGTVAELHPTKGLDVALRAFKRVADDFPDIALVLIGEGEERVRLESRARATGHSDRIRFCGQVADAPRYLSALDLFLLPSRSEALGTAVLEAGLAHLPVVASNVGGIPEILTNDVTGLLVAPDDIEGFAAALRALIPDSERRARLGTALAERVAHVFSKEQMVHATLALY